MNAPEILENTDAWNESPLLKNDPVPRPEEVLHNKTLSPTHLDEMQLLREERLEDEKRVDKLTSWTPNDVPKMPNWEEPVAGILLSFEKKDIEHLS